MLEAEFIIVKENFGNHPQEHLQNVQCMNLNSVELADASYFMPGRVDAILGVKVLANIVMDGIKNVRDALIAQKTKLGWIIFGEDGCREENSDTLKQAAEVNIVIDETNQLIQRLWEIEEMDAPVLSPDDKLCEELFVKSLVRKPGRYGVSLPLKPGATLGDSRATAMRRLFCLEARFKRDPELRRRYNEFIREMLDQDHLRLADPCDKETMHFFIPHHAVAIEKKFRVVFDGSAKTTNGNSLNDIQFSGPKLQPDLVDIVMAFRLGKIALTSDVVKMFRQVELNPEHWDLQRILWRFDTSEPIREYWITRVIYGLASSAYNAVKVLIQAAADYGDKWPQAAEVVKNGFYMDDLLTSVDTENEALCLKAELIALLRNIGYELAKWRSNCITLGEEIVELKTVEEQNNTGVLGIVWDFEKDEFRFKVKQRVQAEVTTKRVVTSEAARVFDSLGLLTPVTIKGKLFIQELWREKFHWDKALPEQLQAKWKEFYSELHLLNQVRIPRWIGTRSGALTQLHVFSDASSVAYGAVVYVRVRENKKWRVQLLCSRSRVAPINEKKLTIPRLELCALTLSCKLIKKARKIKQFSDVPLYAWTDSEIVLHWLRKPVHMLKVFVANRVTVILNHVPVERIGYVRTDQNPADLITRGLKAEELINNELWWNGAAMLQESTVTWPAWTHQRVQEDKVAEILQECHMATPEVLLTTISYGKESLDLIESRSSYLSVCRITAYVIRFCSLCYEPLRKRKGNAKMFAELEKDPKGVARGNLIVSVTAKEGSIVELNVPRVSIVELRNALDYWIIHSQKKSFPTTYSYVSRNKELPRTDPCWGLTPFIDKKGILRLSGRLRNTTYDFDRKEQIILKYDSVLAERIAEQAHRETCHGGMQLCVQYLRHRYWIPNIRRLMRRIVHRCVICCRFRQLTATQLMADLPAVRVTPSPAFFNTGVDYAGPITLKISRNVKAKGYICIFICMAYKAVHLELVSSLEASAFIAALSRFVNLRAGAVHHLYSDNGRNFVGAARLLREAVELWENCEVLDFLRDHAIQWHFNTPLAPHHGGLWEAAVKSMKHHLKRMTGTREFTFEEYATLLPKIAACMNSRPITPLSSDPNDLSTLTPGNFVTGNPMIVPFERPLDGERVSRLDAWKQIEQIQQSFWNRWSQEYVAELQRRNKWATRRAQLKVGELVFIKNELTPPNLWLMGRIVEVYPGKDNGVRSCLVKTQSSELLRPVTQLCLLPRLEDQEQQEGWD